MGTVYLAEDKRLGNYVALKQTFFDEDNLRKAFEREARLLANLHHPALPRVSDHFIDSNGQFLVMQYIPGDDLAQMLEHRGVAFTLGEVLSWGDQLLDALDYLHTQEPPIIHRDIKPQNLKLTKRGQIILLDFGLAKSLSLNMSRMTSGSIFGYTANYAPLEQIQAKGTDARSDVYSLGATLYHLMTNEVPLDALTRVVSVADGQPDPIRSACMLNSQIPEAISAVLGKAMELNRDRRYASAEEMRRALRDVQLSAANKANPVIPESPKAPQDAATVVMPGERLRYDTTVDPTPAPEVITNRETAKAVTTPAPVYTTRPGQFAHLSSDPRARKSTWQLWVIAGVLALTIIFGLGGVLIWKYVQSRGNLSIPFSAKSVSLSAADMEILIPEILPPEAQAQYSQPAQKKELAKQLQHVLAIAQIAEREGYDKRPDVKTQMELMADSRLARAYATKNPDKSVSDDEVKAYIDSHAAEIDGYLEANPRLKKQVEGAELDSFRQTYARIRLMAGKARETGASDEKTADLLKYWSSREVLYQAYVDEMIAKYYDEHKNEYEQVRARHILISTGSQGEEAKTINPRIKNEARQRAESLLARVRKGEDFAKLAGEFNPDDASKETGGDLDYFSRGTMVPEFEQAAFALKPGEVSGLVETQYGFHIIKVEGRRPAPVDDQMTQQQILEKLQPELEKLAESSDVKVAEDFNFTPKTPPEAQKKAPGKQ